MALGQCGVFLCLPSPALAGDWGYDETSGAGRTGGSVEELRATPGALNRSRSRDPVSAANSAGKTKSSGSAAAISKSPSNSQKSKKNANSINSLRSSGKSVVSGRGTGKFKAPVRGSGEHAWLQLLGLVAPLSSTEELPPGPDYSSSLTDDQKRRFMIYLEKERKNGDKSGYGKIATYWPALEKAFKIADHKGNYRLLFRSLLRMRAESSDVPEEEKAIISEALGPKRLAIPGDPALSEDAIKAYADMACFLFEQKNPGKTVDADDNRKLFGLVIRDKFNKAPAYADKLAMCYFPINWAKFRILYTDANEEERKVLVKKLSGAQNNTSKGVSNELLEIVLSLEPWKTVLIKANKLTKPVGEKPSVGALKLGSADPEDQE